MLQTVLLGTICQLFGLSITQMCRRMRLLFGRLARACFNATVSGHPQGVFQPHARIRDRFRSHPKR